MGNARLLLILGIGQVISVLLAMTGFISTNLTSRGFVFPVLQSAGFYLVMSLFLIRWPFPLKMPVYLYAILAIFDVEANFLAVLAYQFTDITSILLLNSLTIPWVVILSYFVLKRRYTFRKVAGTLICLCGLGLVIASDTMRHRWGDAFSADELAWKGDLICVASSFLYALQNVLQEFILKRLDRSDSGSTTEYFGMLGLFGFAISVVQFSIFERDDIISTGSSIWTGEVLSFFFGFILTMVMLYVMITWFIGKFDASLFNMSILTSGIYGLLLEFMQKKASPRGSSDWMYFLAYGLIVAGVVLYSTGEVEPQDDYRDKTNLIEPLSPCIVEN